MLGGGRAAWGGIVQCAGSTRGALIGLPASLGVSFVCAIYHVMIPRMITSIRRGHLTWSLDKLYNAEVKGTARRPDDGLQHIIQPCPDESRLH